MDERPAVYALAFDADEGWAEADTHPDRLPAPARDALLWVVVDLSRIEKPRLDEYAARFHLHPLAVEDALNPRQRPKLERYERHLFFVLHQLDEADGQLEPVQLACFIGSRHVLVVHDGASRTVREAERRMRDAAPELRRASEFLVHALLDTVVDGYQRVANRIEEEVEVLEELVLEDPRANVQRAVYMLKQRVARMRRYALPMEPILATVIEPNRPPVVDPEISHYFRDVHDHTIRIAEQVRNVDALANAILDLQRAEQAAAQNEVTKRLTAWAAIIAVPTLVTSFYGMNFELLPNEGSITGFFFALSVMVLTGLVLFVFFKRRRWI